MAQNRPHHRIPTSTQLDYYIQGPTIALQLTHPTLPTVDPENTGKAIERAMFHAPDELQIKQVTFPLHTHMRYHFFLHFNSQLHALNAAMHILTTKNVFAPLSDEFKVLPSKGVSKADYKARLDALNPSSTPGITGPVTMIWQEHPHHADPRCPPATSTRFAINIRTLYLQLHSEREVFQFFRILHEKHDIPFDNLKAHHRQPSVFFLNYLHLDEAAAAFIMLHMVSFRETGPIELGLAAASLQQLSQAKLDHYAKAYLQCINTPVTTPPPQRKHLPPFDTLRPDQGPYPSWQRAYKDYYHNRFFTLNPPADP